MVSEQTGISPRTIGYRTRTEPLQETGPGAPILPSPCQGSAPNLLLPGVHRPVLHPPRAAGKVQKSEGRMGHPTRPSVIPAPLDDMQMGEEVGSKPEPGNPAALLVHLTILTQHGFLARIYGLQDFSKNGGDTRPVAP